jgi:hypothetical protein
MEDYKKLLESYRNAVPGRVRFDGLNAQSSISLLNLLQAFDDFVTRVTRDELVIVDSELSDPTEDEGLDDEDSPPF